MEQTLALLQENKQLLQKIKMIITQDEYEKQFEQRKIAFLAVKNSVGSLQDLNTLIEAYLTTYEVEIDTLGEQIFAVFGLLQSLFVAIDGLYEITRGMTTQKWGININKNDVLRQIKYIRNDVVGHPNYRLYGTKDVGFISMDLDSMNKTKFTYLIHTLRDDVEHTERKSVDILEMIRNYYIEANSIFDNIIVHSTEMTPSISINSLANLVYVLSLGFMYKKRDFSVLDKIEEAYLAYENRNNKYQKDRYLWRISLLKKCYSYQFDDKRKNDYMKYITYLQIKKLHDMSIAFDKKHHMRYKNVKMKQWAMPKKLKDYYLFLNKHKRTVSKYISNLHDVDHPFFDTSVENLLHLKQNHDTNIFLMNWLKESKKDPDLVYLIGSLVKQYKYM